MTSFLTFKTAESSSKFGLWRKWRRRRPVNRWECGQIVLTAYKLSSYCSWILKVHVAQLWMIIIQICWSRRAVLAVGCTSYVVFSLTFFLYLPWITPHVQSVVDRLGMFPHVLKSQILGIKIK